MELYPCLLYLADSPPVYGFVGPPPAYPRKALFREDVAETCFILSSSACATKLGLGIDDKLAFQLAIFALAFDSDCL